LDDLGCRKDGRERVRLARPQVDEVGITDAAPVGTQWGRQVVDLGIRRGSRVGVLVQEAVPDAAGEPASERAGERCGSIVACECLLVYR
jgi:hypothetical protein